MFYYCDCHDSSGQPCPNPPRFEVLEGPPVGVDRPCMSSLNTHLFVHVVTHVVVCSAWVLSKPVLIVLRQAVKNTPKRIYDRRNKRVTKNTQTRPQRTHRHVQSPSSMPSCNSRWVCCLVTRIQFHTTWYITLDKNFCLRITFSIYKVGSSARFTYTAWL